MSSFIYQELKRALLSPLETAKFLLKPKVIIPIVSLCALFAVGTTLEEAREVNQVNKLYTQNGGIESAKPAPSLYSHHAGEVNRRIDYLKQKEINPEVPLINYLRTHNKRSQKN